MTCGRLWWPILVICALHLTQQSAHTQQWTQTRSSGQPMLGIQGEVGVRCLAQEHLSRGIEGGERAGYSLHPPTIPAKPETQTLVLRVRLSNQATTSFFFYTYRLSRKKMISTFIIIKIIIVQQISMLEWFLKDQVTLKTRIITAENVALISQD